MIIKKRYQQAKAYKLKVKSKQRLKQVADKA
jgi:hypothetical protein